jgi:O-antigen ligase
MSVTTAERSLRSADAGDEAPAHTDAYRFARAVLVMVALGSFDVRNFFDRGGSNRYLLIFIPIVMVVVLRLRRPSTVVRKPVVTDVLLLCLWVMGMIGTTYGLSTAQGADSARPIFYPMSLGLLSLFVLDQPSRDETRRILQILGWIGAAYVVLAAVVNTDLLPGLAGFKQFRNASFALVLMGIVAAHIQRRRGLFLVLSGFALLNFAAYPSATSVIVTLAVIVVMFMTRPTTSSMRPYLVGLAATILVLVAVLNVDRGIGLMSDYFEAVNKVNASYGRLSVWQEGLERFEESPLFGDAFSSGTVVEARRLRGGSTFQIPFHNDYILFLADGGLAGIVLLVTFIVWLNVTLLRRFRLAVRAERWEDANLLRLLLALFDAFFVAAAFNPVIEGLSRSATIFGLYAVAMLIGRPEVPPDHLGAPSEESGSVSRTTTGGARSLAPAGSPRASRSKARTTRRGERGRRATSPREHGSG